MWLINYIKVAVIWLCDLINLCYDPFEDNFKDSLDVVKLNSLESQFGAQLDTTFMRNTGEFCYTLPRPDDAGDTALWQGVCIGERIINRKDVTKQVEFLKTLFINGALIRGYKSDGTINDTTSNDSATGLLFAFYCAVRFAEGPLRDEMGDLLVAWMKNVKAHNWALVNQQGNPTLYGALEDGIKTDPLRMTTLLALLLLASYYDSSFHDDYNALYAKYAPILAYPKVKLLWYDTSYDTHRAAIALHVLYWMSRDDRYKKGLERLWRITKKTRNVWVYTLCSEVMDKPNSLYVDSFLSTFDYEKRLLGNVESLNPDVEGVNWGGTVRAKSPLPMDKRGSQDFTFSRNMNSRDEWVGNKWADSFHSGLDFLVCYGLARRIIP